MAHSTLETTRDIFMTLHVKPQDLAERGLALNWEFVILFLGLCSLHYWFKRKKKSNGGQFGSVRAATGTPLAPSRGNISNQEHFSVECTSCEECSHYQKIYMRDSGTMETSDDDTGQREKVVGDPFINDGLRRVLQTFHQVYPFTMPGRRSKLMLAPLPVVVLLITGLLIAVGMVYGMQSVVTKHVLKVSLPASAVVRKVRSYSEDPDLSDISLDSTSLSLVTRLHVIDYSKDCKNNLTDCSTFALCDGQDGALKCRCKRGYYLEEQKCKACRSACPDNHYMETPCTSLKDVVCKPCSSCEGSVYEAAPCATTQDRVCIGVDFPMTHIRWGSQISGDNVEMNVTSSGNVFMEKLRHIKKLEGTLYITNNQQAMSFMWTRESGLEIKISLSEVYLVPEYVDLEHIDDSYFLLRDSYSTTEDMKNRINTISQNYCRHPLPDQYQLVLEVIPNKTMSAEVITCDSQNSSVAACPSSYKDGDRYLLTSLNDSCSKLKSNISGLNQASNSIVCPGGSPLLSKVLQVPNVPMSELTFPSIQCQVSLLECNQCLKKTSCNNNTDSADCCNVQCYTSSACQYAHSSECPPTPVECANGNVYRFTLLPKYTNLLDRYMCHVQYKQPQQLYKVEYTIHIPAMNYTVAQRSQVIPSTNLTHHIRGAGMVDFMRVSHDIGMSLQEEGIMIGKYVGDEATLFSFHPMKAPSEFRSKKFRVRPVDKHRYSTNIQFSYPFAYSSSTWDKDKCDKNLSKIYPAQRMYKDNGLDIEPTILQQDGVFEYQVLQAGAAPSVRFYINGEQSILSTFQPDMHTAHLDRATLKATLDWNTECGSWNISLSGSMTECPGYITVEIFDKFVTVSLAYYDVLITCGQQFNMSFSLSKPKVNIPDIFVVVLNDSVTSHQLVLTSLQEPSLQPIQELQYATQNFDSDSPWLSIFVMFKVMGLSFSILLPIFVYVTVFKKEKKNDKIQKSASALLKTKNGEKIENEACEVPAHTKPSPRGLLCIFAILYVVYSVLFSFTVMFGLLYVTQSENLDKVSDVSNTSAKIQETVREKLDYLEKYRSRQEAMTLDLAKQRAFACEHHLNTEVQNTLAQLGRHVDYLMQKLYKEKTAYSALDGFLKSKSEKYKERMADFIAKCNSTVQTHLHEVTLFYRAYLQKVADSGWLEFPQSLYASQIGWKADNLKDDIAEFMTWLEVDKVDQVLGVKNDVLDRLISTMPELRSFLADNAGSGVKTAGLNPELGNLRRTADIDKLKHWYKYLVLQEHSLVSTYQSDSPLQSGNDTAQHTWSKGYVISDIRTVLYPVFICIFLALDILLLTYRFTWLRQTVSSAKSGFEKKIPLDSVATKTLFLLAGQSPSKGRNQFDHPYAYYMENKEDLWADHHELYQRYCQVSPKSKEDILREIWNYKKKQKEKKNENKKKSFIQCLDILFRVIYRFFISRSTWRFILVGTLILFLCLICKIADDLLTIETVTFLMDTESIFPQLQKQTSIMNRQLSEYDKSINLYLHHYRSAIDSEISFTNSVLQEVAEKQMSLLDSVMSELCVMGQTSLCDYNMPLPLTPFLSTCNFLPVHTQLFEGYHKEAFKDYILAELFPLVSTLRAVIFRTSYVLLCYACVMIICQLAARVAFAYLIKTKKLQTSIIFQTSNTIDCWMDGHPNDLKDIYRSHSWIESCESGVYVGDNEDSVRESTM